MEESYSERRYRNIVSAFDNLILQLEAGGSSEAFALRMKDLAEVYKFEVSVHRNVAEAVNEELEALNVRVAKLTKYLCVDHGYSACPMCANDLRCAENRLRVIDEKANGDSVTL